MPIYRKIHLFVDIDNLIVIDTLQESNLMFQITVKLCTEVLTSSVSSMQNVSSQSRVLAVHQEDLRNETWAEVPDKSTYTCIYFMFAF